MPLKVYYLDDEPDLLSNFADLFESPQVAITTFSDPQKAIEAGISAPPDLFFIDNRIPGTSGSKVAHALPAEVPKFLVTGDILVIPEYPFKAILGKPYDVDEIQGIIRSFFSRPSKGKEHGE